MTRIVHVSTLDRHGGAARAAFRIHSGLRKKQIDSMMFVQDRSSSDSKVYSDNTKLGKVAAKIRPYIDQIPVNFYRSAHQQLFSPAIVPGRAIKKINNLQADIVHLHWLEYGFIKIEALKKLSGVPVIWTLHDSWAFTGGCHIPFKCSRYQEHCGKCPVLESSIEADLSRWVWNRKYTALKSLDLTIVTPSRWLGDCAKKSSIFKNTRIEVIPNGIDTQMYKPLNQGFCREAFSLPKDKKIIMFGAVSSTADTNQGFDYLIEALRQIAGTSYKGEVVAVVLGDSAPKEPIDIGFEIRFLGHLHDDASLVVAYSASDVFVAPSKQENLPNTVMEAMACGVPCVAFDIGGMPDLIEHQQTGYLAKPYEVKDLANGILWVVEDSERKHKLSEHSRQKIKGSFSENCCMKKYMSLYDEILTGREL